MSILIPFDPGPFDEGQAAELEGAFAAIQQWSNSPAGLALPTMRAYLIANQSIANGADPAIVLFGSVNPIVGLDQNFGLNTGIILDATTGKVTLEVGRYWLKTSIVWAASAVGFRYVSIQEFQFSAGGEISLEQRPGAAGNQSIFGADCIVDVPVGAQYRYAVGVFQDSGGALNVLADYRNTWFQVTKLG